MIQFVHKIAVPTPDTTDRPVEDPLPRQREKCGGSSIQAA